MQGFIPCVFYTTIHWYKKAINFNKQLPLFFYISVARHCEIATVNTGKPELTHSTLYPGINF